MQLATVGGVLHRDPRARHPDRPQRPDLARPRRVHGGRRLHDGDPHGEPRRARLWTIPIAAGVAGGVGLLAGVPALRLSGFYFALATFGIAVALPTILKKFDHLTGGSTGITLFGRPTETGHGVARVAPDEQPVAVRAHVDDRRRALPARLVAARRALRPLAACGARQRARGGGVGREPRVVQGARVRRLGGVRGRRRRAVRDQRRVRVSPTRSRSSSRSTCSSAPSWASSARSGARSSARC